jgi:hypothetical protein
MLSITSMVMPGQRLHHILGDGPLVKRVGAIFGDRPQGFAKLRLMNDVAGHRRLAVRQQITLGVGAVL